MDALGRIFSDVSWVNWVFWFSHHQTPSQRQPSRGDQVTACVPVATHGSALRAFSAASLEVLMALFLAAPVTTQSAKDFTERAICKASTANFSGLVECCYKVLGEPQLFSPGRHAAANQELCGGGLLLSVNLPGVFIQP